MNEEYPYPATGKLYIKLPLCLESPLIIGYGDSQNSDIDIIRDPVSEKPFIPATSIIGVLRSYLENGLQGLWAPDVECNFRYLFGYNASNEEKEKAKKRKTKIIEAQSALQCDDVTLENAGIIVRDGVKIDPKTNTALESHKYNYEVVEKAEPFEIDLEITLREEFNAGIFKRLLLTVFDGIKKHRIRLGAKTNRGFGKISLKIDNIKIAYLDFKHKNHVWQWLNRTPCYEPFDHANLKPFEIRHRSFEIDAWFRMKSAMLIKSYAIQPDRPDAVMIERDKKPVLPGTSVAGAIRHRSQKILNTLSYPGIDEKMHSLFGFEGDEKNEKPAIKGRVLIEETLIKMDHAVKEVQSRIKIDRFTGGTIHGALFEMMPVWQNGEGEAVHIHLKVQAKSDWERALFLFILKDLWTGDLAIGGEKNVGRGVLAGHHAKILWEDKTVELSADQNGAPDCDPEKFKTLQNLAEKLKEVIKQ